MSRKRRIGPTLSFSFAVASLALLMAMPAAAQSSKRSPNSGTAGSGTAGSGTAGSAQAGSGGRVSQPDSFSQDDVALEGYCPVCVIEMKQWVKGSPEHAVEYDGKVYLFPGQEQRDMFAKNPQKYAPVLDGQCTVCRVEMGKNVEGKPEFSAVHDGLRYLFPGKEQMQMFLENPDKYEVQ